MKKFMTLAYFTILAVVACKPQQSLPSPDPVPGPDTPVWVGTLPHDEVQVIGELIDIRSIGNPNESQSFPQNDKYKFDASATAACGGATRCAVSLVENPGPQWVRAGSGATVFVASDCIDLEDDNWKATGKSFRIGDIKYYLHQYVGKDKKTGVKIPRPAASSHSVMVIGPKITVNGTPSYGDALIATTGVPRAGSHINNVTMTILPDGDYLAMCTGSEGSSTPALFISKDRGVSWKQQGTYNSEKNLIVNMFTLFIHRGKLYLMGLGANHMNLYITSSSDKGLSWESPALVFEGDCSTISTAIVESGGRIWKACERYASTDEQKRPFVVSAPADANLLDPSSWTSTNVVTQLSYKADGYTLAGIIEGNMVVGKDGKIYDFLRTNNYWNSGYATRLEVTDKNTLVYASSNYCVRFPGGGKKFVIRYDEASGKYWAMSNPDTGFPQLVRHAGIESLNHGGIRNRLVLMSSEDMLNWTIVNDSVMYNPDPFFHGFQYPDWSFDGNDIIGVVRVACPVAEGLPVRQHDANMMLFFRIKNFRQ